MFAVLYHLLVEIWLLSVNLECLTSTFDLFVDRWAALKIIHAFCCWWTHEIPTRVQLHDVLIWGCQNLWRIHWWSLYHLGYFAINWFHLSIRNLLRLILNILVQAVLLWNWAMFFSRGFAMNCVSMIARFFIFVANLIKGNFWWNISIRVASYTIELLTSIFLFFFAIRVFVKVFELLRNALQFGPLLISALTLCLFWFIPCRILQVFSQLRKSQFLGCGFTLFWIWLNRYFYWSLHITWLASLSFRVLCFAGEFQVILRHLLSFWQQ